MNAFLQRWGLLGGSALVGALIGAFSVGLTRCDRLVDTTSAQAAMDTRQNTEIMALMQSSRRLEKVERGVLALLVWAHMVSRLEGWEPPPEPARLSGNGCPGSPDLTAADYP